MMELVLVTGGAGFIGSHLVYSLLHRGYAVRVLDNFTTGRVANLDFAYAWNAIPGSFDLIDGDLRSSGDCSKAVAGATYVFHQGAIPSVARSVADPLASNQANVDGTLNLLLACRTYGVKRLIFASSSSVYGDVNVLAKVETLPVSPLSLYAATKVTGEYYCRLFTSLYGLETVALRYFNVFGPRQDPASEYSAVIPRFVTALLAGRRPVLYGDGTQSRDFTYISNVVDANIAAMTAPGVAGEVLNVACGQSTSLLTLLSMLATLTNVEVVPTLELARPGDVRHSLADIYKAERLLGYAPVVDLAEGLRRTIAYYLRRAESRAEFTG